MTNDSEYRRNAAFAQQQADATVSVADKASWLRIAASWLAMINKGPQQQKNSAFDAKVKAQDTGQKRSEASH